MAEAALSKFGPIGMGDPKPKKGSSILRAAAILTGSYVITEDYMNAEEFSDVAVLFEYTKGSLTSLQYYVEHSVDGTAWHREGQIEPAEPVVDTTPEHTYLGSDNYSLVFPSTGRYFRLRVKGTGTVTGSSLKVTAVGVN